MDPELGAVDHGAELTCLGATDHGRRGLRPENNISYPTLKFFCEEICMFSWSTTYTKCLLNIILHLGSKFFQCIYENFFRIEFQSCMTVNVLRVLST
jgi:hypothetical protein